MAEPAEARRARQRAQRQLARERQSGKQPDELRRAGEAYRASIRRRIERGEEVGPGFARAVEEYRPKGMNVLAQIGLSVETVWVDNLLKDQRRDIQKHWMLIRDYLFYAVDNPDVADNATGRRAIKRLEKRIRAYEGKMSGGVEPVELANDPEAIKRHAANDPEDFAFESLYEPIGK
jgi:hypothetical protein